MAIGSEKGTECLRFMYKPLAWLPVIVITAIAVWSYFAYVIILCIDTVKNDTERALYLVFYHPIFVVFMYSYWKAIMCDAGQVPSQFQLSRGDRESYDRAENPQEIVNHMARELPIVTTNINGGIRFCEPCQQIKPDRCRHCSMCHRCVLKMDHHCPWINNCVGFKNYKFFFLFLFYAILYTMYVTATSLKYFLAFWTGKPMHADSSLHIMFLFFIAAMFCISLWSLFGYHIFLTLHNRTTLESFRSPLFSHGPDKNGFNLGTYNNIRQVFGNKRILWPVPVYTTLGNGYSFPLGSCQNPESEGLLGNGRVLQINNDREELLDGTDGRVTYQEYGVEQVDVDSDRDSDIEIAVTELRVSERLPVTNDTRDTTAQNHPL